MKPCCPHPVERHAYNGCANCGCGVRWDEHPRKLFDTSAAGREAVGRLLWWALLRLVLGSR